MLVGSVSTAVRRPRRKVGNEYWGVVGRVGSGWVGRSGRSGSLESGERGVDGWEGREVAEVDVEAMEEEERFVTSTGCSEEGPGEVESAMVLSGRGGACSWGGDGRAEGSRSSGSWACKPRALLPTTLPFGPSVREQAEPLRKVGGEDGRGGGAGRELDTSRDRLPLVCNCVSSPLPVVLITAEKRGRIVLSETCSALSWRRLERRWQLVWVAGKQTRRHGKVRLVRASKI